MKFSDRRTVCALPDIMRQRRIRAGLSQAELAELAGTSQGAINRIEKRTSTPNLETWANIVDAFGVKLSEVFAEAERAQEQQPEAGNTAMLMGMLERNKDRLERFTPEMMEMLMEEMEHAITMTEKYAPGRKTGRAG